MLVIGLWTGIKTWTDVAAWFFIVGACAAWYVAAMALMLSALGVGFPTPPDPSPAAGRRQSKRVHTLSTGMESLGTVQLLAEDRELLDLVAPHQQAAATRAVTAPAYRVAPGAWQPRRLVGDGERPFGLLVLDGLLLREVVVAETTCGELVGPGELLRPWDTFGQRAPTPMEIEWKVLTPARIAVLEYDFAKVLAVWPALCNAFVDRAIERSHSLALHVAIHCIRRVDISLLVLFSHLADRFGRVTPDGITLDIPLTQDDLGKLVGATRQSVSAALGELIKRGALTRRQDRKWLLRTEQPEEMETMFSRRRLREPSP